MTSPLSPIEMPMMIFGDSFMRNYLVAYDKNNKKVGFSAAENPGKATKFLEKWAFYWKNYFHKSQQQNLNQQEKENI